MTDIQRTLLGDHEAAKRLTDAGVLVPCPWCKGTKIKLFSSKLCGSWYSCYDCECSGPSCGDEYEARLAWNTRAPILSAKEMEMLDEH